MTRLAPATRSIAPPMPLTILPGIIQFARLPSLVHLQRAEHGEVDVAAADHRERVGAAEVRRSPAVSVTVSLPALIRSGSTSSSVGYGPDAEHAVLRVQRDVDAGRDVVGDQRRHADAEVDVVAVAAARARRAGRSVRGCPIGAQSPLHRRALLDALLVARRPGRCAARRCPGVSDVVGIDARPASTSCSTSAIVMRRRRWPSSG